MVLETFCEVHVEVLTWDCICSQGI